MKKWEYLMVYYSKAVDVSILNTIGEQGWELVSPITIDDDKIRFVFKREKIEKVNPDDVD